MTHSTTGLDHAWAQAAAPDIHSPEFLADLRQRRKEDFDFMVLCEAKGNRDMYRLLRDEDLDNYKDIKT